MSPSCPHSTIHCHHLPDIQRQIRNNIMVDKISNTTPLPQTSLCVRPLENLCKWIFCGRIGCFRKGHGHWAEKNIRPLWAKIQLLEKKSFRTIRLVMDIHTAHYQKCHWRRFDVLPKVQCAKISYQTSFRIQEYAIVAKLAVTFLHVQSAWSILQRGGSGEVRTDCSDIKMEIPLEA